jgi:hypothetical protein
MRRILMFIVIAAPLAFPATAHAFGCVGGGFGRTFTLGAGATHRPFNFTIPEQGTLRVLLTYSHSANPGAKFVVRLRRSTWKAPKKLVDSRTTGACRLSAGVASCAGARANTAAGTYRMGVHKLSEAPATVTLNACWAAPPALTGGLVEKFTLPAGPSHRRFVLKVLQAGTVHVKLVYPGSADPSAAFLVHLRRSTWPEPLTIVDSRREQECRLAAGAITCAGARGHTASGSYYVGVRKLSQAPVTVTLEARWP